MRKLRTYRVVDTETGACGHTEAYSKEGAAWAFNKTLSDIVSGKIRVEKVGDGARYQVFGKRGHALHASH